MSCLQNWRNGFAQGSLDTIKAFIKEYKSELNSPEAITEQIELLLEKTKISTTNSEHYTFAYQWVEWGNATEQKAFSKPIFDSKPSLICLTGFSSK